MGEEVHLTGVNVEPHCMQVNGASLHVLLEESVRSNIRQLLKCIYLREFVLYSELIVGVNEGGQAEKLDELWSFT